MEESIHNAHPDLPRAVLRGGNVRRVRKIVGGKLFFLTLNSVLCGAC